MFVNPTVNEENAFEDRVEINLFAANKFISLLGKLCYPFLFIVLSKSFNFELVLLLLLKHSEEIIVKFQMSFLQLLPLTDCQFGWYE